MESTIRQHDTLKCIEELNELATVLVQQHNKPHKDLTHKIIEELGDVEYRIKQMYKYYDFIKVQQRIRDKWGDE